MSHEERSRRSNTNQICLSCDFIAFNIFRCYHIAAKPEMLLTILMEEERAEQVNANQFAHMKSEGKI